MERKRRVPARAAARVEQAAKKSRTSTPPDILPATPSSAPNSTPAPDPVDEPQKPPPPPLPTSIHPGRPLPTIEGAAQSATPPQKDFQSIQESGVLAESLSRSRQRWIGDGLFEKYWTKPTKKKGVVQEDAKNPPKDTMAKVGQVTISLEPHYFEATVYAVKDPNRPAPQPVFRPILQYGPPNGAMPPPPTPLSKTAAHSTTPAPAPDRTQAAPAPVPSASTSMTTSSAAPQTSAPPAAQLPSLAPQVAHVPPTTKPSTSPRAIGSAPPLPEAPAAPVATNSNSMGPLVPQVPHPPASSSSPAPLSSAVAPTTSAFLPQGPVPAPAPMTGVSTPPQGSSRQLHPQNPPNRGPGPPAGADPIIVTLAEKANEDPQLRDLMKRVANGNAPKDELARFQAIIDQITAESKRKGALKGPSADRLFVDGRSVRYFADEVDAIIAIVLRSNPKQTSADLAPPSGSDPLVVALVKNALDDPRTLDRVRRIAKNNPEFSDATDLKETLDRLKDLFGQQKPQSAGAPVRPNGTPGNHSPGVQQAPQPPPPQQALRSKGPPPVVKPDVSALVFEFGGGNGDRYLFPRFSILEQVQTPSGPQVIASFLIVRKGSTSEYGGDPKLDYYQPVTIRMSSSQPRTLDHFSKVVAPEEEVKRYMEDVMDNMTRAEYVLLAMRLPKPEKDSKDDSHGSEKETKAEDSNHATPETEDPDIRRKGLTWKKDKTIKQLSAKPHGTKHGGRRPVNEDEQYQNFIASVSRKETEEQQ
ncbi:hypothetical protein KVR01_006663 [Diaporthe batatas]|uniref:uncharacterized protein n=1 Tax=Diaporthe batatas TaxID=748121 RepID=UPI001D054848|nr:uncharacterized protein KVR01_006663 [Diaporthe batatas]KAG8163366.1 hypothetical protein KVR01_006663 [Diaporthe batatas]